MEGRTSGLKLLDHRDQISRPLVRFGRAYGDAGWMTAMLDHVEVAPITPKPPTTSLRCRQSSLGPGGDHLPLMFSNSGEDVNCEPVGLREVHRDEIHPALHQVGVTP